MVCKLSSQAFGLEFKPWLYRSGVSLSILILSQTTKDSSNQINIKPYIGY